MPAHHWVVLRHSEKDSKGYPLQTSNKRIRPSRVRLFFVPSSWEFDIMRHYLKNGAIYKKNIYLCTLKIKQAN